MHSLAAGQPAWFAGQLDDSSSVVSTLALYPPALKHHVLGLKPFGSPADAFHAPFLAHQLEAAAGIAEAPPAVPGVTMAHELFRVSASRDGSASPLRGGGRPSAKMLAPVSSAGFAAPVPALGGSALRASSSHVSTPPLPSAWQRGHAVRESVLSRTPADLVSRFFNLASLRVLPLVLAARGISRRLVKRSDPGRPLDAPPPHVKGWGGSALAQMRWMLAHTPEGARSHGQSEIISSLSMLHTQLGSLAAAGATLPDPQHHLPPLLISGTTAATVAEDVQGGVGLALLGLLAGTAVTASWTRPSSPMPEHEHTSRTAERKSHGFQVFSVTPLRAARLPLVPVGRFLAPRPQLAACTQASNLLSGFCPSFLQQHQAPQRTCLHPLMAVML